jgi:hypothetical protein
MGEGSTCAYESDTTMCDRNAITRKTTAAMPRDGIAGARSIDSDIAMPVT